MFVTNSVHFVDSDYRTDFRGAIAGNGTGAADSASAYADIMFARGAISGEGDHGKAIIKSVRIVSIENVTYRVDFYDRTLPQATVYGPLQSTGNLNGLLGSVNMVAPGGTQPSAYYATGYKIGTLFAYVAEGLDIPVIDMTARGQLHVNLVNISGTAKSAGDVGALHLRVGTINAS
jgi:hypothetical protein